MIEFLKSKSVSFYLRAATVILCIVPVFYMANVGGVMSEAPSEYTVGLIFLLIGIAALIVSLVLDGKKADKYLGLGGAVMLSVAFAMFVTGSCLSVIDYIYNIVMWGDATQFPLIMTFGIFLLAGTASSIVSCWLK